MRILVIKRLILQRLPMHGLHITYFSENIWTTPQKKSVVTREPLYFIHKEQLEVLSLRITEVYSEPCQTKFLRSAFSIEQLWWLLLLITIFNFTASDNFVSEQRPKACKVIAKLKSISQERRVILTAGQYCYSQQRAVHEQIYLFVSENDILYPVAHNCYDKNKENTVRERSTVT